MIKTLIAATLALAALTVPACAQGYDWMTPHLDAQRFGNQLRHNQQRRDSSKRNNRKSTRKTTQRKTVVRHPQVQVNGQLLQTTVAPMQVNGYTFVPMRNILEALGFSVNHDSKRHLVTATRGTAVAKFTLPGSGIDSLDNETSFRNGEEPFIRNGVMMVPLRKISETVGAQVKYVASGKTPTISITSKQS